MRDIDFDTFSSRCKHSSQYVRYGFFRRKYRTFSAVFICSSLTLGYPYACPLQLPQRVVSLRWLGAWKQIFGSPSLNRTRQMSVQGGLQTFLEPLTSRRFAQVQ